MANNNSQKNFSSVLIEAMKAQGMNESQLADATGISERFIKLLIKNDLKKLPPAPYLHGYILKIAEVVDMDGEKVWRTYFKNNSNIRSSGNTDHLPKNRFSVSNINAKILFGIIIIIAVIAYFVIRSFLGVDITRELNLEGFGEEPVISQNASYNIKGNINPKYQLKINQQSVYPESDGDFTETINLSPGFNTVMFNIKGPLKREEKIAKEIYYKTNDQENINQATTTSVTTSSIINN
ncbi:MAG TPA: helix-turn-helix transcriptional regulator [Candidatus Paceibacterota bacterium]|nr:helix-turn-helix transcriptional regulator [Candidatus Paceibacterota bacterium]